jgi:hypothetical protein
VKVRKVVMTARALPTSQLLPLLPHKAALQHQAAAAARMRGRVRRLAVTARALPHLLSRLYQNLLPPPTGNPAMRQALVPPAVAAAVAAAAVRVRTSHQMTPHLMMMMMMMMTTVRVMEGMGTRRMVVGQLGQGVGAHRKPVAVTVAVIAVVAAAVMAAVTAAAVAAVTAAAVAAVTAAAVTAAMASRPMQLVMGRKEAAQCPLLQLQLLPPTASSKISSSISDSRHQS